MASETRPLTRAEILSRLNELVLWTGGEMRRKFKKCFALVARELGLLLKEIARGIAIEIFTAVGLYQAPRPARRRACGRCPDCRATDRRRAVIRRAITRRSAASRALGRHLETV